MMLWTWQGEDFDPVVDRIDRSKSDYWVREACPNLRRSYMELDELLCLPKDREHQFVWCSTTAPRTDWYGCCLWPLDVPPDSILAYLDSRVWEHLIGSDSLPDALLVRSGNGNSAPGKSQGTSGKGKCPGENVNTMSPSLRARSA